MGTITMSGYNNIDWSMILNATMKQESQVLESMKSQYTNLQERQSHYSTLATKLSSLESAAEDLQTSSAFSARTATSTDSTVVGISAGSTAMVGNYDVVVTKLARAQVTTTSSATAVAAKDTVVASNGGSLSFNGGKTTVNISAGATLEDVAGAINSTDGLGIQATVISADGKYQLSLTSTKTGKDNAFTVESHLDNGSTPTIGFSYDSGGKLVNAMTATDADFTVNNVRMTSSSNTIESALPDITLTLYKENSSPTVLSVTTDASATKEKLKSFVSSYNAMRAFFTSEQQAAKNGDTSTLATDSLARGLRQQMSSLLLTSTSNGSSIQNLMQIGVAFEADGTMSFDESTFDDVQDTNAADIENLLGGTSTVDGVFDGVKAAIKTYTQAGGLIPSAKDRLTERMTSLSTRIDDENGRLAIRKLSLQQEYSAADQLIASLNSQGKVLSSV